jgi:minimal PKS ketosynthase (KS/KS alpha)
MRRTAITGIGVVAPGGASREDFWKRIIGGQTATRRITFFDPSGFRSQVAAECDFDPYAAGLDDQQIRRMDRYVQFAVAAAVEAATDGELDGIDRDRLGVSLGSAVGGAMYLEEDYVVCSNRGRQPLVDPDYASPFLYQAFTPRTMASEVALTLGAHGPAVVLSTGYTAGIDAIGQGHEMILDGEADVVIAGGADAPITPTFLAGLDTIKATSQRNHDPAHASRPFDRDRDGFVLGEGGAVLILEEMESALARNAHVYCEVAGFAVRANAYHMTGLRADGLDLAETISDSLRQAGMGADQLDYVCAHGSGTRQSDRHETAALKRALENQAYEIPVSSIKGVVGHALGGAGPMQIAAAALCIERGIIPPTANWQNRDPDCDLDYTPGEARERQVDRALVLGSSFGGFQCAMILARPTQPREVGP